MVSGKRWTALLSDLAFCVWAELDNWQSLILASGDSHRKWISDNGDTWLSGSDSQPSCVTQVTVKIAISQVYIDICISFESQSKDQEKKHDPMPAWLVQETHYLSDYCSHGDLLLTSWSRLMIVSDKKKSDSVCSDWQSHTPHNSLGPEPPKQSKRFKYFINHRNWGMRVAHVWSIKKWV